MNATEKLQKAATMENSNVPAVIPAYAAEATEPKRKRTMAEILDMPDAENVELVINHSNVSVLAKQAPEGVLVVVVSHAYFINHCSSSITGRFSRR